MFDANGFCVHELWRAPLLAMKVATWAPSTCRKLSKCRRGLGETRQTVRNAVHYQDNVVDANVYPLQEPRLKHANRKIGLGVMGLPTCASCSACRMTPKMQLKLGEQIMAFIEQAAHENRRNSCESGQFSQL
jgi:ribosomal protein S12